MSIVYGIERISTIKADECSVRIVQWLVFSGRRLGVEELSEVVAICLQRDPFFDYNKVLKHPEDVCDVRY